MVWTVAVNWDRYRTAEWTVYTRQTEQNHEMHGRPSPQRACYSNPNSPAGLGILSVTARGRMISQPESVEIECTGSIPGEVKFDPGFKSIWLQNELVY